MYSNRYNKPSLLSFFLLILSFFYGMAVKIRGYFYKIDILKANKLPCIIISIGNITVGGTGKTPMTIYTTNLISRLGYKVVVISRGYKGTAEKTGGIVSNEKTIFMDSKTAGDEPLMIAQKLKGIPVIIGKNRFAAGNIAIKEFNPDVIVLDDAFQHLSLMRDINLLLIDSKHPFGNDYLVPRGILREPVSSVLRSDAVIFTRVSSEKTDMGQNYDISDKSVFFSSHSMFVYKIVKRNSPLSMEYHVNMEYHENKEKHSINIISGKNIFVFSGIANNNDFLNSIKKLNCHIKGFLMFNDHHQYSSNDLDTILQSALKAEADIIVTTHKDYIKIADMFCWPVELVVLDIAVSFGKDMERFSAFIESELTSKKICNTSI